MDYLRTIAEVFVQELKERYPERDFVVLKLQAPGYAVSLTFREQCFRIMVKVTTNSILVDRESIITRDHRRLLEVDWNDPEAINRVMTVFDAAINEQ